MFKPSFLIAWFLLVKLITEGYVTFLLQPNYINANIILEHIP